MRLGDRMKWYESATSNRLMGKAPTIIRLDGVAFHTFTKGMKKPFDEVFLKTMQKTAKYLRENIQGCELAYVQSDEISLYLQDDRKNETEAWHGKKIQKMVSVAASMATMRFNIEFRKAVREFRNHSENDFVEIYVSKLNKGFFDGRVFTLPNYEEVRNYFLWRQRDCLRNSINSAGQFYFPHKQLQGLKTSQVVEKLYDEKGITYAEKYSNAERYGTFYFMNMEKSYDMSATSETGCYVRELIYWDYGEDEENV